MAAKILSEKEGKNACLKALKLVNLVFLGLLGHIDDRVIGLGVPIYNRGGRSNGILAANGGSRWIERLGGHQVGG